MAILSSFSLQPPRSESSGKVGEQASFFRLTYQMDGNQACLDFSDPMVVLGRAKTCDVVIPLAGVSRSHATIMRDGDGWTKGLLYP